MLIGLSLSACLMAPIVHSKASKSNQEHFAFGDNWAKRLQLEVGIAVIGERGPEQ